MKKFSFAIIFATLITIVFTGCEDKSTTSTATSISSYTLPDDKDDLAALVDTLNTKLEKVDHIVTTLAIGNNFDDYTSKTGAIRKIDSIRFIQKDKELREFKKSLSPAVSALEKYVSTIDKLDPEVLAKFGNDQAKIIEKSGEYLRLGKLYLKN